LAAAIVLATHSPTDPRTLSAWGQAVGASRGSLRAWCKAAGVSARSALDFLRILRAVVLSKKQEWNLFNILDVVDQRSLYQLLDRGGIRDLCRYEPPTVDQFILNQRFLGDEHVLKAIARQVVTADGDSDATR
jgi:hypothetical protein